MINLFVNHFQCGEKKRQAELDFCFQANQENEHIDRVRTFSNRPTYYDFFKATSEYPDDVNILANSDIYFNDSLVLAHEIVDRECFALTRWELEGDKVVSFDVKHQYNRGAQARHSQDVWIFRGTVKGVPGHFHLGRPGCDNAIAYQIYRAGYRITNPCYDIQAIHKHESPARNYTMSNQVPKPWKWVEPCNLIHRRTSI